MNASASVTNDDGDKVDHGWSQLDIAKHSTNVFVASLGENDYVSVVIYSDGARVSYRPTTLNIYFATPAQPGPPRPVRL